jgi:branched-chain amino acid transport system ATP-binding protein
MEPFSFRINEGDASRGSEQGISIVLVEQNAELALELARHGYVLETGNVALQGEAKSLMDNDHVRKAYLGI